MEMAMTWRRNQKVHKFENGYGASVLEEPSSSELCELFEVGIIRFDDRGRWSLCYDSGLGNDVHRYLTQSQVDELLQKISELPISDLSELCVRIAELCPAISRDED
jgi:hypothetical protein